ncbi:MAG: hypothetical protein ACXWF8_08845 [Methylobacter sp.]
MKAKDSNNILQSYTDVLPGRPTIYEHRAPEDDLQHSYDRHTAQPLSKMHALTIKGWLERLTLSNEAEAVR